MKHLNSALLVSALLFSPTVFAKEFEVEMKSISFNPKTIEITAGDQVVWKNISYTDHIAAGEGFDTGTIHPKEKSKPIAFAKPGTYNYNCQIHGKTMSGIIKVSEQVKNK